MLSVRADLVLALQSPSLETAYAPSSPSVLHEVVVNRQEIIRGAIADLTKRSLEDVNPSSRLAEDLGIRSIACVELAVLLERRLGIAVREDQVMTSGTVSELEHVLGA